jgi:ribonuclease BN (tRNA processing enzyme)
MSTVAITFLGSGDAFGSGGRLQACLLVESGPTRFLIDCGPSALAAMKMHHIDPATIRNILISHLHGDHFGGIPFLLLDGHFSKRREPLRVVGPTGTQERVRGALEVLFPRSSQTQWKFGLEFVDLSVNQPTLVDSLVVTAAEVIHPCGAPPYALRVEVDGKSIAYSGDTEWTDALVGIVHGADVFICEAYTFEKKTRYHLDYSSLVARRAELGCGRLVITHMSPDMLGRANSVDVEAAHDGMRIEL